MSDPVTAAWVHEDEISCSFFDSFLYLLAYDLQHEQRLARGGWISTRAAGGYALCDARNDVVADFLKTGSDWLCWFDSDMGFAPDTIDRLMQPADVSERPIVGALCFGWITIGRDGLNGTRQVPVPTIYDRNERGILAPRLKYRPGELTRCDATGSACIVIHRSVFERLGPGCYDREWAPDGKLAGEDLSFCARAGAVGIPIYVDTSVPTSHAKTIYVTEDDWRQAIVRYEKTA